MSENIPGRRITGDEYFYTDWVRRTGDGILLPVEDLKIIGPAVAPALETGTESGAAFPKPVSLDTPLLVQTAHGMARIYFKEYRRRQRAAEATRPLATPPAASQDDASKSSQQPRS